MVTKYGMSEAIGPMALESAGGRVLFGSGVDGKEFSAKKAEEIDHEVKKIIDEAYAKAEKILIDYRVALDAIAKKLLEVENLERAEYEVILREHNIHVPERPSMNLEDRADDLTTALRKAADEEVTAETLT
jgi:cell division protease FtsH